MYSHLPPITKTIQVRRTRHCWRSKDEIVSDVLLWTPAYGQSKAGRPAWTFIQQLCDDMGCNPKDLPKAMNDRETWRERVRDIRASRMSWWWWWYLICIYKEDLALNNPQWLTCHKTKPDPTKSNLKPFDSKKNKLIPFVKGSWKQIRNKIEDSKNLVHMFLFANGPGDLGSIPGTSHTKDFENDTSLLNTQQYKVRIKGKEEQSRERSNVLSYISEL